MPASCLTDCFPANIQINNQNTDPVLESVFFVADGLFEAAELVQSGDAGGFVCDVSVDVVRVSLGGGFFYLTVLFRGLGVALR
jgi:hypothetical protein